MWFKLLRKASELRVEEWEILTHPVTVLMWPRKFSNSDAMLSATKGKSCECRTESEHKCCKRHLSVNSAHSYLLPRRMLMRRLPLITVQSFRDCAASTESMSFPSHTLSHKPSQALQNILWGGAKFNQISSVFWLKTIMQCCSRKQKQTQTHISARHQHPWQVK